MPSYDEQIKDIEDEIRGTQYNKATQHHIGLLKAKIAQIRDKQEARGGGKKGTGYSVRKSGDATVVLVGFPSVGKSTILNRITNAESKIGAYAFTTLTVVPGVMKYSHAKIQILDVPGLIKGAASGTGMGKEVLSVIRNADLLAFIAEPYGLDQVDVLKKELYNANMRIDERAPDVKIVRKDRGGIELATTVKLTKIDESTIKDIMREFSLDNAGIVIRQDITPDQLIDVIQNNKIYVSSLVIVNKADLADEKQLRIVKKIYPDAIIISAEKDSPEKLKKAIFDRLRLMRVYLKESGKKADLNEPLIMREGSTVADLCARLHKDFIKKFRYAKIWGSSAKFPGQIQHENHILKDKDVVQVALR